MKPKKVQNKSLIIITIYKTQSLVIMIYTTQFLIIMIKNCSQFKG